MKHRLAIIMLLLGGSCVVYITVWPVLGCRDTTICLQNNMLEKYKTNCSCSEPVNALNTNNLATYHGVQVRDKLRISGLNLQVNQHSELFPPAVNCPAKGYHYRKQAVSVYEGVMLNTELDMLEAHIFEAYQGIDKFVIVESSFTFQGDRKALLFEDNKERFERYMDKILYISAEMSVVGMQPFVIEGMSRNIIVEALLFLNVSDTSILVSSDIDEIVSLETLLTLKYCSLPTQGRLEMPFYYYSLHWIHSVSWNRPFWRTILSFKNKELEVSNVRFGEEDLGIVLKNSGWHCSCFGNASFIVNKLHSFSHSEFREPPYNTIEHITLTILAGKDFLDRPEIVLSYVPTNQFQAPSAYYLAPNLHDLFVLWDKVAG